MEILDCTTINEISYSYFFNLNTSKSIKSQLTVVYYDSLMDPCAEVHQKIEFSLSFLRPIHVRLD